MMTEEAWYDWAVVEVHDASRVEEAEGRGKARDDEAGLRLVEPLLP